MTNEKQEEFVSISNPKDTNREVCIQEALKVACERLQLFLDTHGDFEERYETQADINDWLTQLAALREDFVMVPREPDYETQIKTGIEAMRNLMGKGHPLGNIVTDVYKAMISAQTTEKPNDET